MYLTNLNFKQSFLQNTENQKAKFAMPQNTFETSAPNFGGFTRLVMNNPNNPRPFYSTKEFLKISEGFKSKIVGKLPKEFLGLFPNEPKKIFKFLDELSGLYKEVNFNSKQLPKELTLILQSGKQLKTKFLGKGDFGQVFKIDINEKSYAFKAFYNKNPKDFPHGPIAEIRSGLNTCGQDYCDMEKFYIGNFEKDKEWQIMEYIDKVKDYAYLRYGKKINEDRPDLFLADDDFRNRINGIRIDLGGVDNKKPPSVITKIDRNIDLSKLPTDQRKQTFYDCLSDSKNELKEELIYQTEHLKPNDKKQAFYDYIDYKGSESQIKIKPLWFLDEADKKEAFCYCLNHTNPEVRKGMASQNQIGCLKLDDRKQAFDDCLNHFDSEAKKGLSNQISSLMYPNHIKEAFDNCLKNPDASKGISSQIKELPADYRKKAFYDCLNHTDYEIRKNASFQIEYLNQNDQKQAFYNCLNHSDLEIKKIIGSQISVLDPTIQKQAFDDCLKDTEAKKKLSFNIQNLDKSVQEQAFSDHLNSLKQSITLFQIN